LERLRLQCFPWRENLAISAISPRRAASRRASSPGLIGSTRAALAAAARSAPPVRRTWET